MTRRRQRIHQRRSATEREQWPGMCPAGLHGIDYKGQACDVCAHDANPAACRQSDCRRCWVKRGGSYPTVYGRSATELELYAVARPDQPSTPRDPVDSEQELAARWSAWLTGGER